MDKFEQMVYPHWQIEVADGITLLGFHEWIEQNRGNYA